MPTDDRTGGSDHDRDRSEGIVGCVGVAERFGVHEQRLRGQNCKYLRYTTDSHAKRKKREIMSLRAHITTESM